MTPVRLVGALDDLLQQRTIQLRGQPSLQPGCFGDCKILRKLHSNHSGLLPLHKSSSRGRCPRHNSLGSLSKSLLLSQASVNLRAITTQTRGVHRVLSVVASRRPWTEHTSVSFCLYKEVGLFQSIRSPIPVQHQAQPKASHKWCLPSYFQSLVEHNKPVIQSGDGAVVR